MPGGTFIYLYFTHPYGKELTVNVIVNVCFISFLVSVTTKLQTQSTLQTQTMMIGPIMLRPAENNVGVRM